MPGHICSEAEGVSADGSVVAGWSCANDEVAKVDCRALTWTGTQPVTLPFEDPEADYLSANAYAVSASGGVIVGDAAEDGSRRIVRWAAGADAPVPIENVLNAWPHAVSDDGSVIAATGSVPNRGNLCCRSGKDGQHV